MGHFQSLPTTTVTLEVEADTNDTTKTTIKNQHDNTQTSTTTTTNTTPNSTKTLPSTLTALPLPNKNPKYNIIHDPTCCMFKLRLDTEGNTAALCYLPTKYKSIVEFYHIEIPTAYRNLGLGDLLLQKAFEWAEGSKIMVIPTCPFVMKYLTSHFPDKNTGNWLCILPNCKGF